MKDYYIFGLQRSGTNFLHSTISLNFNKRQANEMRTCWKHSIDTPKGFQKGKPTIIIHKNPYTWVESISLRNNVDWVKTQTTYPAKEQTTPDLTIGPMSMNITNLAKTYKHFYDTWLGRTDVPYYMTVQYEDLLVPEKRDEILSRIRDEFKWSSSGEDWRIPERGKVSQSKDYTEVREEYYKTGVPAQLNQTQIDEITHIVTPELITSMGYQVLDESVPNPYK